MTPIPTENPVPRVVTFTARGNAALDQLADALVAECDGSPGGIADILELVLEADVEDLAECPSETTASHADRTGRGVDEVAPARESPDQATRRRLGQALGRPTPAQLEHALWQQTAMPPRQRRDRDRDHQGTPPPPAG